MSGPYLLFELGALTEMRPDGGPYLFGIDVAHVYQVIESARVVQVPLAPSVVEGVFNHLGRIFTAVDPAPLLGLEAQPQPLGQVVALQRQEAPGGKGVSQVALKVVRTQAIVAKESFQPAQVPLLPCVESVSTYQDRLVHIVSYPQLISSLVARFDGRSQVAPAELDRVG